MSCIVFSKEKFLESRILAHLYDLEFTQLNPLIRSPLAIDESLDAAFHLEATRERFPVPSDFSLVAINQTDVLILKELADDPRASISTIADRVKIRPSNSKKTHKTFARSEGDFKFWWNTKFAPSWICHLLFTG